MHYRRAGLAIASLLVCALSTARADTLEMPAEAQQPQAPTGNDTETMLELPAKGMSMSRVAARFGDPSRKLGPVGDPPITRWVYDQYTVYFEGKYVIHSVLNRK